MLPEGKCRYIDGQIYPDGNFYVLDTEHIKHNGSELKSALNGIGTDISNKVDKVAGKGLSTEDYTTAEKNKLSGIEANANDYVHPTTSGYKHIPSGGSSGKILGWSADGTAAWVDPTGGGGGSVDTVYIGSTEYAPDANGKVTLPTYPTTLPASDVYSWAKASTKPSYTASEVGAVSTVANQGLTDTEKANARTNIGAGTSNLTIGTTSTTAAAGDHTHNYAGSSSAGGAATSANKLNTNAGSATQPVYFSNGVPVATTYSLGKSVPSNAKFTDTTYSAATTSAAGLMSASDKTKLNGIATGANKIGYELKEISMGQLTWSQSMSGMYYTNKVSINSLTTVLGITIYGFVNLRNTDVIIPRIYGDNQYNGISLMANTNSFITGASLYLLVFGIS